jgi:2-(3-amino-3-carboxypropyl)histidine synthase
MNISDYVIDIEHALTIIQKNGYKTIALQIPEGLKRSIFPMVDVLKQKTNATILVSADPCFGACDIADYGLRSLGVEFVLHIGHTPIPNIKNYWIPTMFITASSTFDVTGVVKKALTSLRGNKIGVLTTAQHLHTLESVIDILHTHHFTAILAKGDSRISHQGQILGCNFSAATKIANAVDCFLFIGSGTFHPVGLLISSKKPVVAADPYTNLLKTEELEEMKNTILRQRHAAIIASQNAHRFGILIGVKQGQQRLQLAYKLQQMLTSAGKQCLLITQDEFSPIALHGFDLDCYVSTACPRIAIDDYVQYKKPIITPVELEIALGNRSWDEYVFDEILS